MCRETINFISPQTAKLHIDYNFLNYTHEVFARLSQKAVLANEDRVRELLSRSNELCNISNVDLRRKPKCVELDYPNLNKEEILTGIIEHALGKFICAFF